MDLPTQHGADTSQMGPRVGTPYLSIASWVIGTILLLVFVIMSVKCLMGHRAPRPTAPGPLTQGPPIPAPPQVIEGDAELGIVNDHHDKTATKSSTARAQPRVPPPPYCRRPRCRELQQALPTMQFYFEESL
ncbi:hypothetical protein FGADI_11230 [Fusarium gaditjirri]|uniref:Uncharacterized protein n=1 Tax=Fusarium gaditjirri TaxID=282569 RepID=A0A8H4SVN0_9HYPO|nr:hypothetical protein FGADI_11230 [Fusarium gaditjirri]